MTFVSYTIPKVHTGLSDVVTSSILDHICLFNINSISMTIN
ncbi:hypothetical protein F383_16730 [Gossypium arboreum]|uniref:Uncharacterized protein n=1 Tax=Gossypium arboreum TaxID=29729 RepID=A0A0B0NJQ4_GOSAR|nr:hypothetical protein F383_16730 [Gossypium arboreum]